jgi:sulfite dehydrogenase (cytochrome) subunit B
MRREPSAGATRVSPIWLAAACAVVLTAGAGAAKPLSYLLPAEATTLRPGPGMEAAQNNCASCHSVDYIARQPPKRGREFWEAEVNKMIRAYHAPISEADAKAIVHYLAETY